MYFLIDSFLPDVLSRLTNETRFRVLVARSVREIRLIRSSSRLRENNINSRDKSMDLLTKTTFSNISIILDYERWKRTIRILRGMSRWVGSIGKIGSISSSMGNRKHHVIAGGKSMNLFIETFFADVFSRLHHADTNESIGVH